MSGVVLWITGLPGSGKSALADAVKRTHPQFGLLRMDELRGIATPEPTYSEKERDLLYRSMLYTARQLTALGHDVIIDATGNLRRWRQLARELFPAYVEVYLRCPMEVARRREETRKKPRGAPPGIYEKGERGWPVPGLAAPYEEPHEPDIILDSSLLSVAEELQEVTRVVRDALAGRDATLENRAKSL
jgi:adenylylsulfate kinase